MIPNLNRSPVHILYINVTNGPVNFTLLLDKKIQEKHMLMSCLQLENFTLKIREKSHIKLGNTGTDKSTTYDTNARLSGAIILLKNLS